MNDGHTSAGDAIPPAAVLLEVHVAEVGQLFNAIDPSPFREKDLDREAEAFIVDWARDSPRKSSFALLVHLDRTTSLPDDAGDVGNAIRAYFADRAQASRRKLKRLFSLGRISLAIGLAVLATLLAASELLMSRVESDYAGILRESLFIGGWVAMWRPLEIFLYDWWPILADARLHDRLGAMPVRVQLAAPRAGRAAAPDV